MKTFTLPGTDMVVPNVVLGLMRIRTRPTTRCATSSRAARDAGIDFLDHADVYGATCTAASAASPRRCSSRPPSAPSSSSRPRPASCRAGPYFDFSYEHIVESVDGSLAALDTDYIDILLLHRPDALVEPDEVARAFDELEAAGKVRAFGVSNHTPGQIELLQEVRAPAASSPTSCSCRSRTRRSSRRASRRTWSTETSRSRSTAAGSSTTAACNDITIQAWSPFQAGFFTGVFLGSPDYPELNAVIDRLAAQYDVPPIAIATAWITRHPAQMQVVLGTTSPERVARRGARAPTSR